MYTTLNTLTLEEGFCDLIYIFCINFPEIDWIICHLFSFVFLSGNYKDYIEKSLVHAKKLKYKEHYAQCKLNTNTQRKQSFLSIIYLRCKISDNPQRFIFSDTFILGRQGSSVLHDRESYKNVSWQKD